jgi:hypothetical protein
MKRLNFAGIYFLLLTFLCSCTLFSGRTIQDSHIPPSYQERIAQSSVALNGVLVEKTGDAEQVRRNGDYICRLLLEKRNARIISPEESFTAFVRLKEDSFLRDFQNLNTIAVEISLYAEDHPVAFYLFSQETESSLSSYSYLYSALEKALKRIQ